MVIKKISIVLFAAVMFLSGCESSQKQTDWDKISKLDNLRMDLEQRISKLEEENQQLRSQITKLTSIDQEARQKVISRLARIEISSRSGLFDKDK